MTDRGAGFREMGEESNSAMKRDEERADEVARKDSGGSEGRGRGSRIEAPRSQAATGCAYFMAATYHKSLSLTGRVGLMTSRK